MWNEEVRAVRILHAADLHLDSPFSSLDPQQSAQRRAELRDIPARLAQVAREEGVDLVLLPGDLFDGERVYPQSVQALAQALGSVPAPVFLAPGNHDPYTPGSPYATYPWPDNVHIFTSQAWEGVPLEGLGCVVHGCAFTSSHREDSPLTGLNLPRDGQIHLLCVHGELAPQGRYAPMLPGQLGASGANYVALGHVHAPSGLQREGGTWWAYPGCPEGRGFDETGDRGCLVVEVTEKSVTARPRSLCHRRYLIQEVDWAEFDPWLAAQGDSPHLMRILLTGVRDKAPALGAYEAKARPHFFPVEVEDHTTLPSNLWQRAGEDSLTGLFLRSMERKLETCPPEDQPRLLQAIRFGLAALEGEEDICP